MELLCPVEEIRKVEIEILNFFHNVCVKYGLKYSLGYGTMLGAVRHKGFIPWDDDIDVLMPRADYENLFKLWPQIEHEQFILMDHRSNPDSENNFAKIKKDHTAFVTNSDINKSYHKGIYIDVFPVDRVAPGFFRRNIQFFFSAVNLLYSRKFTSGTGGMIGFVERVLLSTDKSNYIKRRDFSAKIIQKWNNRADLQLFSPNTISLARVYHPANMFDDLTTIEFEGKKYCSIRDTDGYLKREYGDYMQLPPAEEQVWKHGALVLNTHYNYEEIIKAEE